MSDYIMLVLRRFAALLIVLVLIATLFFSLFFVLSGPDQTLLPKTAYTDLRSAITEDLKLDEPIYVQYANYMWKVFTGKFFLSSAVYKGVPAGDFIFKYMTRTLLLMAGSALILTFLGATANTLSSGKTYKALGSSMRAAQIILFAFPSFMLIYSITFLSARFLPDFPLRGFIGAEFSDMSAFEQVKDVGNHLILPVAAIVLVALGSIPLLMNDCRRYLLTNPGGRIGHDNHDLAVDFGRPGKPRIELTSVLFLVCWFVFLTIPIDMAMGYHGLGTLLWNSLNTRDYSVLLATAVLISFLVAVLQFLVFATHPLWAPLGRTNTSPDVSKDASGQGKNPAPPASDTTVSTWIREVSRDFWSRKRGVIAALVLLAMAVIAVLSPVLSPVGNPMQTANAEPNDLLNGILNPLPPTFEKSPRTGFVHPLGTDSFGRDVLGLTLYAAGPELIRAVALSLLCVSVAFLTGVIAYAMRSISGTPAWLVDRTLTVVAYAILAIPVLVIVVGPTFWSDLQMWTLIEVWAWAPAALLIREEIKMERTSRSKSHLPDVRGMPGSDLQTALDRILARSLFIGKFTAIMAYLAVFASGLLPNFVYGAGTASWNVMIEHAYQHDFFAIWAWWGIVPPIIGVMLLLGAVYVLLDTFSKVFEGRLRGASKIPSS